MVVKGNKPQNVDFKSFNFLTLTKVTLQKEGKSNPAVLTAQFLPPPQEDEDEKKPKAIKEEIAKLKDTKPVTIEFHFMDEQNLKLFTVDGAEVKVEGTFSSIDDDEEEEFDEEEEEGDDE